MNKFFKQLIRIAPLTERLRENELIKNKLNKYAQSECMRNPFLALRIRFKPLKSSLAESMRNHYDKNKKIREGRKKRMNIKYISK